MISVHTTVLLLFFSVSLIILLTAFFLLSSNPLRSLELSSDLLRILLASSTSGRTVSLVSNSTLLPVDALSFLPYFFISIDVAPSSGGIVGHLVDAEKGSNPNLHSRSPLL